MQDSALTMERQINHTVKICYFHLRKISKIRRYLTVDACKALVQASIISRLDYCNVLYMSLPATLLSRLQRVQNSAARVICRAQRSEHISPHLKSLHWLPVLYRVQYKVLLHVYKAIHGLTPSHIQQLVQVRQSRRQLRSSERLLLEVPKVRTVRYGQRTFRFSAAQLWNPLPENIKMCENVYTFKKCLKTYLFRNAFIDLNVQ